MRGPTDAAAQNPGVGPGNPESRSTNPLRQSLLFLVGGTVAVLVCWNTVRAEVGPADAPGSSTSTHPLGRTEDVTGIAQMGPVDTSLHGEQLPCYSVSMDLFTGEELGPRTPCDYVISLEEAERVENQ